MIIELWKYLNKGYISAYLINELKRTGRRKIFMTKNIIMQEDLG